MRSCGRPVPIQKVEAPRLWIVAGPNGSGKSTLYSETDIEGFGRSVWIINPDLLAARISEIEDCDLADANMQALDRIRDWLDASIRAHQTVGVETVLSTDKYRSLVDAAKALGFEIRLIYVLLDNVERNIERVRLRVLKGGHAVPEDRIRARQARSLAQLPWFLDRADWAVIFDNSRTKPRRVGQKIDGMIAIDPRAPAILKAALGICP